MDLTTTANIQSKKIGKLYCHSENIISQGWNVQLTRTESTAPIPHLHAQLCYGLALLVLEGKGAEANGSTPGNSIVLEDNDGIDTDPAIAGLLEWEMTW